MPRFYVEKDGEWNIFSTITDDFIFDEFVCLDALKARLLYERYKELTEDIDSLLTDKPGVNVMDYEEAMERRREQTEPQTKGIWNAGYKTGYDKGYKDAQKVKDSQDLVKDLVKTESNSEKPNNCEDECEKCKHFREEADTYTKQCEFYFMECHYEPKTESQTDDLIKKVKALQEYLGIKREPTLSEMVEGEPQAERSE